MGESTLTSDQLDFWDMYKTDTPVSSNTVADKSSLYEKNAQELQKEEEQKEKEEDLSQGGTKTKVVRPDVDHDQCLSGKKYLCRYRFCI